MTIGEALVTLAALINRYGPDSQAVLAFIRTAPRKLAEENRTEFVQLANLSRELKKALTA